MSDGFIYFIKMEETGDIKIGFTENHPKGRLKMFQTGNSNKLTLLGYIEGTYQDEYNLHEEFSEERIRKENEWFKPSPRLVNRIKELLEGSLEDKKIEIKVLNQGLYNSEYKDGEPHGQGTLTWSNGDKYVGEYKDGEPHGQGTYTYSNGRKYVGGFKDGLEHGQGTTTFHDGGKFVGEFKDGYGGDATVYDKNGNITLEIESGLDGEKYFTEYKDGMLWKIEYLDKDGNISMKGKFVNGKMIKQ